MVFLGIDKKGENIMPFFGLISPNIDKLKSNGDTHSLINLYRQYDIDTEISQKVYLALKEIGESAIEPLYNSYINSVDTGVYRDRRELIFRIHIIRSFGFFTFQRVTDILLSLLRDTNTLIIHETEKALFSSTRDETSINLLVTALTDDNYQVRISIVRVLGVINKSNIISPLISAIKDKDPRVRQIAVETLGKVNVGDHSKIISSIIAASNDYSPEVRKSVIDTLQKMGPAFQVEFIDTFIAQLNDGDKLVQNAAVYALVQIGEPALEPIIKSFGVINTENWNQIFMVLEYAKKENLVKLLLNNLSSDNKRISSGSSIFIYKMGKRYKNIIEELLQIHKYSHGRLNIELTKILRELGEIVWEEGHTFDSNVEITWHQ